MSAWMLRISSLVSASPSYNTWQNAFWPQWANHKHNPYSKALKISLVQNIWLFPKFPQSALLTFWDLLFTDKQTNRSQNITRYPVTWMEACISPESRGVKFFMIVWAHGEHGAWAYNVGLGVEFPSKSRVRALRGKAMTYNLLHDWRDIYKSVKGLMENVLKFKTTKMS